MTHDPGFFFDAVRTERERAAAKGYDAAHDDKHGPLHLLGFAISYNTDAWYLVAQERPWAAREAIVKSVGLIESTREAYHRLQAPESVGLAELITIANYWGLDPAEFTSMPEKLKSAYAAVYHNERKRP